MRRLHKRHHLHAQVAAVVPGGVVQELPGLLVIQTQESHRHLLFDVRKIGTNNSPGGAKEASEPEPDVSVVRGSSRDYIGTGHPAGALLVVEVSDTTLRYDRGDKASLYARHGIADYWIVNLVEGQVEVRRDPVRDEGAPHGWRYQAVTILQKGQTVTPLLLPQAKIVVADMLP